MPASASTSSAASPAKCPSSASAWATSASARPSGPTSSARARSCTASRAASRTTAGVYAGFDGDFDAIRYHSLAIDPATLPPELIATSWADSGVLMGVRHRDYALEGVQFHPESIMTTAGHDLLRNFLSMEQPQGALP